MSTRTGQPAGAAGARQVRAAVSALAASGGMVTWLCLCAAGPAHPGYDDPVAGPLLARSEPVRVLVRAAGRDPDGAPAAAVVAEAAVGAVVGALVEALWDTVLPPASAERIEEITRDPVKLRILGLLESGAKDEVIARALGVSLRTCRRHIAELLSAADAVSRFQAASALARADALGAARRAG